MYAYVYQVTFLWGDEEGTPTVGAQAVIGGTFVTSPIIDLLQGTQDRLYTRLFSS